MFKKVFSKIVAGAEHAMHATAGFVKRNAVPALRALVVCSILTFGVPAFAEGESSSIDFSQSANAITNTATGMQKYIEPVQNVCYIIAALIGLIGGLTTAVAMSNHEQDVTKKAAFTFGGMIFMVVVAKLIPLFFNLTNT